VAWGEFMPKTVRNKGHIETCQCAEPVSGVMIYGHDGKLVEEICARCNKIIGMPGHRITWEDIMRALAERIKKDLNITGSDEQLIEDVD
jgi:hypothetical protein